MNCNNLYLEDFEKFKVNLHLKKFENLFGLTENFIDNTPLFLNSDGNLLILKDETKMLREPNEEEIKQFCKPKGKYSLKSNVIKEQGNAKKVTETGKTQFNKCLNKNRIKEQAIQIKVKKEEEKKGPFDIEINVKNKNE